MPEFLVLEKYLSPKNHTNKNRVEQAYSFKLDPRSTFKHSNTWTKSNTLYFYSHEKIWI